MPSHPSGYQETGGASGKHVRQPQMVQATSVGNPLARVNPPPPNAPAPIPIGPEFTPGGYSGQPLNPGSGIPPGGYTPEPVWGSGGYSGQPLKLGRFPIGITHWGIGVL